ncbi:hypothetical protein [Streptosporangium roseum]|uniref:hypothetical protein n=1 Tax=Streptosporangium roseum TaxID=2001 RepID=UPI00332FBF11
MHPMPKDKSHKDKSKTVVKMPKLFRKKKSVPQNTTTMPPPRPSSPKITTTMATQRTVPSVPDRSAHPILSQSHATRSDPRLVSREKESESSSSGGYRPRRGHVLPPPGPEIVIHPSNEPGEQGGHSDRVLDSRVEDEIDAMLREIDDLVQQPVTDKPFELNVYGMPLTVDFTPVARLEKGQEADFIDARASQILGRTCQFGRKLMGVVGNDDPAYARWLMRALCLISDNQDVFRELGVDPGAVVQRLIKMANKQVRMSMAAPNHGFVMQVLQVGGLMCGKLLADLTVPDQRTKSWLFTVYNPGGGADRRIGALDPVALHKLMTNALAGVVKSEFKVWHTNSGNFTEPHKMEDIGKIANFIQGFMKERFGDFPLAAIESPYHKGWAYSNELVSTESKPGDDAELLGWLTNRGDLVGWGKSYGSPFARANYDPSRPEDRQALRAVYDYLLSLPKFKQYLKVVSRLTACHSRGQGKVMVQPWHHNTAVTSKVNFRWQRARTLIHEFLHTLTHENIYAVKAGHKQILVEGFTELITVEVFTELIAEVQRNPEAHQIILGDELYVDPDPGYLKLGYAEAGVKAQLIADSVTVENIKAAYFLGATKFIGL